eukprot:8436903-Alexandrium_andersonii.AAC.1
MHCSAVRCRFPGTPASCRGYCPAAVRETGGRPRQWPGAGQAICADSLIVEPGPDCRPRGAQLQAFDFARGLL